MCLWNRFKNKREERIKKIVQIKLVCRPIVAYYFPTHFIFDIISIIKILKAFKQNHKICNIKIKTKRFSLQSTN